MRVAEILVEFKADQFGDDNTIALEGRDLFSHKNAISAEPLLDPNRHVTVNFMCGQAKSVRVGLSFDTRIPMDTFP